MLRVLESCDCFITGGGRGACATGGPRLYISLAQKYHSSLLLLQLSLSGAFSYAVGFHGKIYDRHRAKVYLAIMKAGSI